MKIMRAMILAAALVGSAAWVGSIAGKPPAPVPSLRDQMIGTWKLESRTTKKPDGSIVPLAGWDGGPGYITYDRNGFMSVQFMALTRTKENPATGYTAYFGPYTVDENTKIVTHHIIGDIAPEDVGLDQPREVVIEGDKLSLYIHNPKSNPNSANININSFTRMH